MQAEATIQNLDLFLGQSVQQVLRAMCFTMVDAPADPPAEYPVPCLQVELDFRGARDGKFWLLFPRQTAHQVASTFSGTDSPYDQTTDNVLRELANMICGSTLSQIAKNGHFDLDSAVASWITQQPSGPRIHRDCRVDFHIGDKVVSAAIAFEN
jgi:CheY-specific phosphatase CheX